jgi:small subunit ribosomal protein S17
MAPDADQTDADQAAPAVPEDAVVEAAPTQPPAARATPAEAAADDAPAVRENARKVREGIVVSDKMQSSIVVAVSDRVRHPRFRKTVLRTKRLYAHDEGNEAKVGDLVRIVETRPLSKLKRWRLTEIVERAR